MPKIYKPGNKKKREKAAYAGSISMVSGEVEQNVLDRLKGDSNLYWSTIDQLAQIGYTVKVDGVKDDDKLTDYKASVYAGWADMKDAGLSLSIFSRKGSGEALMFLCAIMIQFKFRLDIIDDGDVEF